MPALNIYIPDELKIRMDQWRLLRINWAKIVRPSIERELLRLSRDEAISRAVAKLKDHKS